MEIKKKVWSQFFQLILENKKKFDLRLADFDLKENDIIIFEEYDPKIKKYTGRSVKRSVKNLNKFKITDFNSIEDIEKYGHYIIELK